MNVFLKSWTAMKILSLSFKTNNARRGYIKHGKQYFALKWAGVYGRPERAGMGQRWELVKKAELKA